MDEGLNVEHPGLAIETGAFGCAGGYATRRLNDWFRDNAAQRTVAMHGQSGAEE